MTAGQLELLFLSFATPSHTIFGTNAASFEPLGPKNNEHQKDPHVEEQLFDETDWEEDMTENEIQQFALAKLSGMADASNTLDEPNLTWVA